MDKSVQQINHHVTAKTEKNEQIEISLTAEQ
jgi:hypothetical protein